MANRLTMAEIDRILTLHTTEHSNREIARLLGIAPNSLGPIRRRCLERLKQILIQNGASYVRREDFEAL